MPRIAPAKKSHYAWFSRMLFFIQKKKYGSVPDPVLLWGRSPTLFRPFLRLFRALNRRSSPIEPKLRALISVKVSQINSCTFCVDMNSWLVLKRGGDEKLHDLNS